MIDYMTQFNLVSKPLERYMRHYLSIIMCISSVISVKSGQKEHLKMRKELGNIYMTVTNVCIVRSVIILQAVQ